MDPPEPWVLEAACAAHPDPDLWFRGAERFRKRDHEHATWICGSCPVQLDCLLYAITEDIDEGIYGGLTPKERHTTRNQGRRNQ
jgi:hypothetical protein